MIPHGSIEDNVLAWLEEHGVQSPELTPISGGGNNQTFRVDSQQGRFLLKRYFRHPQDPQDRLTAEFAFLRHLWDCGIRKTAEPLAQNAEFGIGLYSFIGGRAPTLADVTQAHAEEALSFILSINTHQERAATLGRASDSCFTLAEHLDCVDRRIEHLSGIEAPAAGAFVRQKLAPTWRCVRAGIRPRNSRLARCLSPSDFGFHNAIITEEGGLRFIDFEYAGWDDPAKLICDFFAQPRLSVPITTLPAFIAGLRIVCEDKELASRVRLLWPLHRIKWICIVLNCFLPLGKARRDFAGIDQAGQLNKAEAMLTQIEWTN